MKRLVGWTQPPRLGAIDLKKSGVVKRFGRRCLEDDKSLDPENEGRREAHLTPG